MLQTFSDPPQLSLLFFEFNTFYVYTLKHYV